MTSLSANDQAFYVHYVPFVRAYVGRRIDTDAVDDLVAEVFATAWRRRDVVPDDALPWLYRTARNVIGNRYRSNERRRSLHARLHGVPAELPADPATVASERDVMIRALDSLSNGDRELILLTAWEGLTSADAAKVLAITEGAAAVRIHRARKRLDQALDADDARQRHPDEVESHDRP